MRRIRANRTLALRPFLFGTFAVVSFSAANALPRDDVMSNAYRCSSIADSRLWLDCYYGAAQPVRSALNLPPVTENQARLTASPPTGGILRDVAAREAVMAGAARCYVVEEDKAWLDCYYGSAESLRTLLGLSPIHRFRAMDATTAGPGADFRTDSAIPDSAVSPIPKNTGRVVSRMVSYSFDWNKIFTVTLANGQIWRQRQGDTAYAHWKLQASGYLVTITRGALGSFNLQVQGGTGSFKVERLK